MSFRSSVFDIIQQPQTPSSVEFLGQANVAGFVPALLCDHWPVEPQKLDAFEVSVAPKSVLVAAVRLHLDLFGPRASSHAP